MSRAGAMRHNPLVSVVIPVFNVEKYLNECVQSVSGQDYENIEIILVDDGSTDSSGEMCDEWASKDSRIKVIHKKNEGLNYARRDGLGLSSGEYITFLDSDDLLHVNSINHFVQKAIENDADVVVAGFFDFNSDTEGIGALVSSKLEEDEVRLLQSKDDMIRYSLLGEPSFPDANYMTACGKLFSRKLVDGLDWSESNFRSYEDNFWTPQVLMNASKIVLVSSKLYFYRRNVKDSSGSNSLGNRLTGNLFNGKPVGYLEYLDLLHSFHIKLSKRYNINIDEDLEAVYYQWSWNRLCALIDAESLDTENNIKYVKDIWLKHQNIDWKTQQNIAELDTRVQELEAKYSHLKEETESLYGIKASAHRLLGNIKRRIFRP